MHVLKPASSTPAAQEAPRGEALDRQAERPTGPGNITFWLHPDGSIERVDAPAEDRAGFDPETLGTASLFRQIHAGDRMPVFRGVAALVSGQEEKVDVDFRLRRPGGLWQAARGTIQLWSDGRTIAGLLFTVELLSTLM